ncbi:MAG: mechanosensitive ion channel family protein, partial [Candidatus Baltobacteraceae bacterium]
MPFHGITFVGVSATNGEKLLFTFALIALVIILRLISTTFLRTVRGGSVEDRFRFWGHQAINVFAAILFIVFFISIWAGPHTNLATLGGLIGAGIAFALQRFIIAIAGYG